MMDAKDAETLAGATAPAEGADESLTAAAENEAPGDELDDEGEYAEDVYGEGFEYDENGDLLLNGLAVRTDHWGERWNERDYLVKSSQMSLLGVKSNIVSGLVCAGLLAGGGVTAVESHSGGVLGLVVMGGVGFLLNALGVRRDRRHAHEDMEKADRALTREWIDEEIPPNIDAVITAPPFTYADPASGWEALDLLRSVRVPAVEGQKDEDRQFFFPELREAIPLPSDQEMEILEGLKNGTVDPDEAIDKLESREAMLRAQPTDPRTVQIMYGTIAQALQIVLNAAPEEAFPVGPVLDPRLEQRLDMFVSKLGLGASPGCVFDVKLVRADGGIMVIRYDFPGDGGFGQLVIPLEQLNQAKAIREKAALGVPPAPPLEYADPAGVWAAVDGMRSTFSEVDEAIRQAVPNEAEMRAAATTPDGARPGFDVLALCVQQLLNTSTMENLDARLTAMASIIGTGAAADTTLDLPLNGSIVRYTFDGAGGVDTVVYTPDGPLVPEPVGTEAAAPSATQATEAPAAPAAAPGHGAPERDGL